MRTSSSGAMLSALLLSTFVAAPASAQSEGQQAVKQALNGKHFLVTYREGGAVYGTYYFRDVYFCPSGLYLVQGQSRKETVMGNTQVYSLNDRGVWDVSTIAGRVVLRSRSQSGQVSALPISLLPDGGIWLGDGVTVVSRGLAPCQ